MMPTIAITANSAKPTIVMVRPSFNFDSASASWPWSTACIERKHRIAPTSARQLPPQKKKLTAETINQVVACFLISAPGPPGPPGPPGGGTQPGGGPP